MDRNKILINEYTSLKERFGNPEKYWPQWCSKNKSIRDRELIIIGMILTQRTTWHNANIALKNLKKAGLLSISALANLSKINNLIKLTRPAGFFQSKPKRLLDVCKFVEQRGGVEVLIKNPTDKLRTELLNIKGIGKETADTILLYALDKPCFIIDEYTRRWASSIGIKGIKNYDEFQRFFHEQLKPDFKLYQDLHALIIISQKNREKAIMEVV